MYDEWCSAHLQCYSQASEPCYNILFLLPAGELVVLCRLSSFSVFAGKEAER
jgi:hypothetical protein